MKSQRNESKTDGNRQPYEIAFKHSAGRTEMGRTKNGGMGRTEKNRMENEEEQHERGRAMKRNKNRRLWRAKVCNESSCELKSLNNTAIQNIYEDGAEMTESSIKRNK